MKSCGVTIQMKATEQYFPVILIITLYKVYGFANYDSLDEILMSDHSKETWRQLSFLID